MSSTKDTRCKGFVPFKPPSFFRSTFEFVGLLLIGCIGFLRPAWAGNAELVIPPNSHAVLSSSGAFPQQVTSSMSTLSVTEEVVNTPTSFYSFRRYPVAEGPSSAGHEIQGVVLIDVDHHVTVWWIVYGIWNNQGMEHWEARLTKSDGTIDGIHWHTEMKTVNGVYQKCFISSEPVTGTVRGEFCEDDPVYGKSQTNTIVFGLTRTLWFVDTKVEVWNASLTHNGSEIWATPWLLGDLRLLNPNSGSEDFNLVDSDGQLISDLGQISQSRAPAPSYVAADGLTPLLFRVGSTPEVPVTLKVTSHLVEDGTLTDFYRSQPDSVSISPVMQLAPNGNRYGVGLYSAPPEFSSAASSEFSRTVNLQAEFAVPWRSSPVVVLVSFELLRPPLMLIHGMWSDTKVWDRLFSDAAVCGERRECIRVDWSPADTPLPNNVKYVDKKIRSLLEGLRQANVAITQMDVIAHSAGGPLFRLYRQSSSGNRPDNFFLGDFRKMLTIGSPHHGTPIADFVSKVLSSGNPYIIDKLKIAFFLFRRNTSKGIIEDLRLASSTMQSIQPTAGLAHAWIGSLPSLAGTFSEKILWSALTDICIVPPSQLLIPDCLGITPGSAENLRSRVFDGEVNDGLVGHSVQSGGVSSPAQTLLSNTAHTQEIEAVSAQDVAALLDSTSGELDNGGFQ